jgi:zinc protease
MMKSKLFFLGLAGFASGLMAQPKLVEKVVKKSADEVVIPYEKYVLPNGLTILMHEDHSDPIVHVDVTYHVGSAREEIGKSGFAHFFEHMMFQGSDHVADEQHFKIITEAGGTLNGTTNRDRTNYFETVPSNQLEKMLWLEADRMGFLLDAVTQQKFEVQRATVKNERGQNYDNRPYGLVQETMARNIFPYGHPYSWLTIGYVEDLNRVNVQDLKNFFLRWYGPNNAVITVGGDLNAAQTLSWIEKYFGSIPRGPEVSKTILPQPVLSADRYVSMMDDYAKIPMLYAGLPGVPSFSPDEAALDCFTDIFGGSNTSILYQRLVKTQKATRANCFHMASELAGNIQFAIMPKSGTPLAEMEKELRLCLQEFESKGVSDEDVARFRQKMEAAMIDELESVSGKASMLAEYYTFTGNANYIKENFRKYTSVTKEDVMRVYNQYVKGKPMLILSVLTKGNETLKAAENNYRIDSSRYQAPEYGYSGLMYNKAKDNFDRSKMPPAGANPSVKEPVFVKRELDGMRMIYSKSDEIPTVVLNIRIPGGSLSQQSDVSKIGISEMFSAMMSEDNQVYSAEQMSVELEKLGSDISIYNDLDAMVISVRCLRKNLDKTLDLMEARLLKPKFLPETFSRIRNQMLEELKNRKTRAASVASQVMDRILYGDQHFRGLRSSETSLNKITIDDLNAYYKNAMLRQNLEMVVVGSLSEAEAFAVLERMKKIPSGKSNVPAMPAFPRKQAMEKTVYLVDIPRAAQTEFRVGYLNELTYSPVGEYYRCVLANYPLGGNFNSRLNLNLRENHGWTYGARSGFSANAYNGEFQFSAGIKAAATDSALNEIIRDIQQFSNQGSNKDEISFMKNSLGQSEARKYETGFQKAGFIGSILRYNLKPGFVQDQNKLLAGTRVEDVNKMAKKWLDPSRMHILLVGDKAKILPGLEAAGYKIVELTTEGEVKKP